MIWAMRLELGVDLQKTPYEVPLGHLRAENNIPIHNMGEESSMRMILPHTTCVKSLPYRRVFN